MADEKKGSPASDDELLLDERAKVDKPRRFVVVFHNDDYTTQEFVVHVLLSLFHKSATEATQIMLHVHHRGWGVAGTYHRDVAESKVAQTMAYAKAHGHPLRLTAEPEGYEG